MLGKMGSIALLLLLIIFFKNFALPSNIVTLISLLVSLSLSPDFWQWKMWANLHLVKNDRVRKENKWPKTKCGYW